MSEYLIKLVVESEDCDYEEAEAVVLRELTRLGTVPWKYQAAFDLWTAMILSGRVANETTMVDAIAKAELFISKMRVVLQNEH